MFIARQVRNAMDAAQQGEDRLVMPVFLETWDILGNRGRVVDQVEVVGHHFQPLFYQANGEGCLLDEEDSTGDHLVVQDGGIVADI